MDLSSTIVAVSSATGPAARMIVRAAGPGTFDLLPAVGLSGPYAGGSAQRVAFRFDGVTCDGWLYAFVGPRSYTGDDALEFHLPGSPMLVRMLIDTLVAAGGRLAGPGGVHGPCVPERPAGSRRGRRRRAHDRRHA